MRASGVDVAGRAITAAVEIIGCLRRRYLAVIRRPHGLQCLYY